MGVLLAVAAAVCTIHRGTRQATEFTFLEAKLRISGAKDEDFYQLAERVYQEGGSPERVKRLCHQAMALDPEARSRYLILILKAHFHPDCVREMDTALATGDVWVRMGEFEKAKRQFWRVLELDWALSSRATADRAERARIGLFNIPSLPWTLQ